MRPKENIIEEFVKVRKPDVTTSGEMDKRTLDDSLAAMEQTIRAESADHKPSTARIITLSRMIKLTAAAAVIIVGISLFLSQGRHAPNGQTARHRIVAQSSAKMMSMMSLRMAYRRGGLDALDQQLQDTLEMLGPQSSSISMRELLEGVNGI
ncbi:MAG: hypothetical protein FVQ84_01090 [Planctomycetes bacterium]|nr:hypothetical protein [Planctomycetota bacterium]